MIYKFIRDQSGDVLIDLHVVPNAHATEIIGQHGDSLKIRIAAPPVDGAANKDIIHFFSVLFGVKKSSIEVIRGETSKMKTIVVEGIDIESANTIIAGQLGAV